VETENGRSTCGGYLDVEWIEGKYADDPGRGSFIFTLRNHLGVSPKKFAQKRAEVAAYMSRNDRFCFSHREGFVVCPWDCEMYCGLTYEAPDEGVALFCGDGRGVFRAARWELWQVI
jgi:hypothetical protein